MIGQLAKGENTKQFCGFTLSHPCPLDTKLYYFSKKFKIKIRDFINSIHRYQCNSFSKLYRLLNDKIQNENTYFKDVLCSQGQTGDYGAAMVNTSAQVIKSLHCSTLHIIQGCPDIK